MSLSLALILNAIADVALVGGLAWFMSRPARLERHVSARQHGHRLSIVPARKDAEQQERIAA